MMTMPTPTPRHADLFLFVARAPVPGETKTRLGRTIGPERAATIYAAFLVDLCAGFTPATAEAVPYDFGWAYCPAALDYAAVLTGLGCAPPPAHVQFVGQTGDGLAARLTNLFQWATAQGYRRTVIMATDSPHLTPTVATAAFAALDDHAAVIGRTSDGGYYLIGLVGCPDILAGAPLSSGQEAEVLIARAAALGLAAAEIAPSFDVDEAADLVTLRAALGPAGRQAPATWAALNQLDAAVAMAPVPFRPAWSDLAC